MSGEDLRGGVGIGEGRDARLVEDLLAGLDRLAPHPAGEHRLAGDLGVLAQRLGGRGRVAHGLGGEDHQQAVDVGVLGGDLQRPGIALGVGVAEDVDRVAVAPGGRQEGVERLERRGGELGELAAGSRSGRRWPGRRARRRW